MKRTIPTYRQRLARALNSAGRITLHDADLIQAAEIERIRVKAGAHLCNNPAPRALYIIG